jgi:predicted Rossmann-fold nucleotide-binding protein
MAMNKIEKMSKIQRICVYCGSSPGADPAFAQAARAFGEILAKNGIGLVYGRARQGRAQTWRRGDRHHS